MCHHEIYKSACGIVFFHCLHFLTFLLQVDGADIKYNSPEEEEVTLVSRVCSPCWDSFSMTPPDSGNCSRQPSSPHSGRRGVHTLDNHREPSPRTSPFAISPSFPSSPPASTFRLFEGAQRRQALPCLPVTPALNHRGCSLTETSRALR